MSDSDKVETMVESETTPVVDNSEAVDKVDSIDNNNNSNGNNDIADVDVATIGYFCVN